FTARPFDEDLAVCDEALLDSYLERGSVSDGELAALIEAGKIFPCWFGSGLRGEGVKEFMEGLNRYTRGKNYPAEPGAAVFKISRDASGVRCTHLRVTGGALHIRDSLRYTARDGESVEEKITGLRVCLGAKWSAAEKLEAGETGMVLGFSRSFVGQGLGAERDAPAPVLTPALTYRLTLPGGVDVPTALPKLRELEEEDPLLRFAWNPRLRDIEVQLMGQVQIEVLKSLIEERFAWEVRFDAGHVTYRETIAAPVEGAGHYEPLRHYAEVHLLLEPLERGAGIHLKSDCPTDALDLNWQRLILTHLAEKPHLGVLTGFPVTDLRITLTAGRAHLKHTEGGDFRQATYRAVRQGLMKAQSVLLEPYYSFRLEVPLAQTGRAISDVRAMYGTFTAESGEHSSVLTGTAPVSTMRDYAAEVAAYTGGRGKFSCVAEGFRPCHNTAEVAAAIGYDPEADLENSPDSVFCAHGAGFVVKWDRADEYMHLDTGLGRDKSPRAPRLRMGNLSIDDKELEAIMVREFGPIKRPMYSKSESRDRSAAPVTLREKKEYLVVDGYNVIFAWEELKALAEDNLDLARQRLAEILVSYRGLTGSEVVLVFDGYAVKGNPGEKSDYHGLRVVYTKQNESADLYIQELLHDIGKNSSVRVVTSDNLIRLSALGSGILRTSAREFGNEVDWVMGQIGDILRRSAQRPHMTRVSDAAVRRENHDG
ncbi:MAG: TetM/TetW/TetO/TetS family tetracycline resistance ribosomal protection protein, partial [Oscillospiraceae bacterium]|nr:TetM/TetW/TetO/TetS family tetracycline resistance ribosomal protection protein [Oscillospiraceae bacterium]